MTISIRQRVFKDREIGEAMRDADDAVRALAARFVKIPVFDAVYAEPMYVGLTAEPWGIRADRIRDLADPEGSLLHESSISFVWEGSNKRARIITIEGLSVGDKYRFNLTAVY